MKKLESSSRCVNLNLECVKMKGKCAKGKEANWRMCVFHSVCLADGNEFSLGHFSNTYSADRAWSRSEGWVLLK